ncbi:hypothetical protein J4230_04830 [Candidatus Woesearchaeota archaeon]|nr:hypothetical protein [Candidatus Woesearchaeota archaeon]
MVFLIDDCAETRLDKFLREASYLLLDPSRNYHFVVFHNEDPYRISEACGSFFKYLQESIGLDSITPPPSSHFPNKPIIPKRVHLDKIITNGINLNAVYFSDLLYNRNINSLLLIEDINGAAYDYILSCRIKGIKENLDNYYTLDVEYFLGFKK